MRIAEDVPRPPITLLAHRDPLAQFIERGAIISTDGLEQLGLKCEGRLVVPTDKMRTFYAASLFENPDATLDDLREVVETFEDAARIARRVFGGAHPLVSTIEHNLRISRTTRDAREAGKTVVFAEPT